MGEGLVVSLMLEADSEDVKESSEKRQDEGECCQLDRLPMEVRK